MKPKHENKFDIVQIQVNSGDGDRVYHPGDTIHGIVKIQWDEPLYYIGTIEIKVGWEILGTGASQGEFVETWIKDDIEILEAGTLFEQEFSAVLPSTPWSYEGKVFSIAWGVFADIFMKPFSDVHEVYRFALHPRG